MRGRTRGRALVATTALCATIAALAIGSVTPANAAADAQSMPIPQTQYSLVGFDSQSPAYPAPPSVDGTAQGAIDGDYTTEWTSAYSGSTQSPMPHYLTIDAGGSYLMTGLDYSVKRGNGEVADYAVYATDDASVAKDASSSGWGDPVATGTFQAPTTNTQIQEATFTRPVTARYVKFVALSAIGGGQLASASELRLLAKGTADSPLYSVTTGSLGTSKLVDDTPESAYIDRDGTFYAENSHSLYGATQGRAWQFNTGTNIDTAKADKTLNNSVNPADPTDSNADTTARCNNSPTGVESTYAPAGSSYSQRNFCDLTQLWVDPDTGDWYGVVHNEFTPQPFGDGLHYDALDYAVSHDQGKTWTIVGHAITSPYSTTRGDTGAFPQQTYYYGDGDPRLYVDTASGYFYVYYGSRVVNKSGSWVAFYEHVARAPIADKMATGSWQKYYDGTWSQPGVGGKESNLVPISATNSTGYTPTSQEYNQANAGNATQQIVAGLMPNTSPLFVMDITYDAYLGLYIGEPQNPNQSGNDPQQYYASKSLSDPKWFLLGDSGGAFLTASWYRWFMDSATASTTAVVGKSFRSYCSFSCNGGASGQYANITVDTNAPASPVTAVGTYRIGNGSGQVLSQVPDNPTTVTSGSIGNSVWSAWTFTPTGDGAYTLANAGSGELLGVDSSTTSNRAWGTVPTVSAATSTPSVGQQWFLVPNTDANTGKATGGFRLVNRYSGLVLGMSGDRKNGTVQTTPGRTWDVASSTVDSLPLAAQQTLTITKSNHGAFAG
ncbi:MAG: discoidin domain-containing protein [Humibacter sp.]